MNNASLYALTVLIWGSTWYAITFQLGDVHPVLSVTYRFIIAACALFAYVKIIKKKPVIALTKKQHINVALQGFFLFSVNYVLFYFGTKYLTSGLVAIIFSTMTVMNIFNQAIFFRIKINPQVALGSIVGLIGISLVFWPEITNTNMADTTLTGILLCLAASYCASLGNMVSIKNSRDNIPVLQANSFGMAYGAAFSLMLALMIGAPVTFEASAGYIGSLLYLAILGSAVAFGCYLTLMKNIGADKAAYATVLFPIVALVVSTLFEGYIWTTLSILGVTLTVIGNIVAMANRENMLRWRRDAKAKELLK